MGVNMLIDLT